MNEDGNELVTILDRCAHMILNDLISNAESEINTEKYHERKKRRSEKI